MPPVVDPRKQQRYITLRQQGWNRKAAAQEIGVSYSWAIKFDKGHDNSGAGFRAAREEREIPGVLPRERLSPEAVRALDDFGYFRLRYFGRKASPWQEEAAYQTLELLESPDKEFLVVNCPPGSGKSTLFTHDLPAWLTCRNRSIRGLIGSRTSRQAETYTGRLRRTFERTRPMEAKDDERQHGLAVDAEATLAMDFGRFKPEVTDIWKREQFVVEQLGETSIDEKESTWTAFGMDSGSLGWRVNFIIWDDLVDKTTIRTLEATERQREWWDDEAETRLEPSGLLVLAGQRLSSTDLYRYCLDKQVLGENDEELGPKYRHVKYKAHYVEQCKSEHKRLEALPYPDGCLLDPVRLAWRDLPRNSDKFQVVYQQEDVDPSNVLVPKLWVDGGRGVDGVDYPGCWDNKRGQAQIPQCQGPTLSVVTCDPSPTRFWAIQWWLYDGPSEFRYLLDLVRQAMDAPDFLYYHDGVYSGLLEEWWQRANDLGKPFTHVIVEHNAAQRFMLQQPYFQQWASTRKVHLIPHQTHLNKHNDDYGVKTIAPHWKYGRVRLPGMQGDPGRIAALKLVDEVTRYPDTQYDDNVMAEWFLEFNLPKIWRPNAGKVVQLKGRPSWIRRSA